MDLKEMGRKVVECHFVAASRDLKVGDGIAITEDTYGIVEKKLDKGPTGLLRFELSNGLYISDIQENGVIGLFHQDPAGMDLRSLRVQVAFRVGKLARAIEKGSDEEASEAIDSLLRAIRDYKLAKPVEG